MTILDELRAGALLGTARRPPVAPVAPGPIGEALADQPWEERPESAVLRAAAIASVTRRVSIHAVQIEDPAPSPPPADDRPFCSPAVRPLIEQLCAMGPSDLDGRPLEEIFRRIAARGERVPPDWLPGVLDVGGPVDMRSFIAAGGPVLRWLAEQRPEWARRFESYPPEGHDPYDWKSVPSLARSRLVRDVREQDPAAGRELAQLVLKGTRAQQARTELVGALYAGLGMDDEPWLEELLDDRTYDVAYTARGLLQRLPESAYRKRMAARLRSIVTRGEDGKWRIELPDFTDEHAERDGLARRHRTEQLWILVERVGFPFWRELVDERPARVLELIRDSANFDRVFQGLCRAASDDPDVEWVRALAQYTPGMIGLLARVDEKQAVAMMTTYDPRIVLNLGGSWGPLLSRHVTDLLAEHMSETDHMPMYYFATGCHVSELARADRLLRPLAARFPVAMEPFITYVDLRLAIEQELPPA